MELTLSNTSALGLPALSVSSLSSHTSETSLNEGVRLQFDVSGAVEDPELLGLVKLQNIAGFWKLDEVLSEHLTIPFHRLKASQPETWSSSSNEPVTDQIWGSAIVLAYLEARMPALAHEWEHMAKKGRAWLIEQTSTFEKSIPAAKKLVDELIVQAKPVVDLV